MGHASVTPWVLKCTCGVHLYVLVMWTTCSAINSSKLGHVHCIIWPRSTTFVILGSRGGVSSLSTPIRVSSQVVMGMVQFTSGKAEGWIKSFLLLFSTDWVTLCTSMKHSNLILWIRHHVLTTEDWMSWIKECFL